MTVLLPPTDAGLARAAELLREGALVAIPTETVYGLAGDATRDEAIARTSPAKQRPSSNPLIVHVPGAAAAARWTSAWDARAAALAEAFWPGPLTLVLPAAPALSRLALAGGSTVGLRAPRHALTLRLLDQCGLPLAAPSANPSNGISPTTAQDVLEGLGGRIAAVLEGGPCSVGLESTVVDLTGPLARVLRPGMVLAEELAEVLGEEVLGDGPEGGAEDPDGILRSPGLLRRHYAPRIPLRLLGEGMPEAPPGAFLILPGEREAWEVKRVVLPAEPDAWARSLYRALRHGERSGCWEIVVAPPPHGPGWEAIHDRLRRAAAPE